MYEDVLVNQHPSSNFYKTFSFYAMSQEKLISTKLRDIVYRVFGGFAVVVAVKYWY